jgi:high-affinity nickel permease
LRRLGNCGDNTAISSVLYPYHNADSSPLVGPVTLAYTFGLRHALDADHIAAIDNVWTL